MQVDRVLEPRWQLDDNHRPAPNAPRREPARHRDGLALQLGVRQLLPGGDQTIRGDDGYMGDDQVAKSGVGRLDVGDLHVQIRRLPKPVVAMVAGYAVGGGHILHLVCDLTIAADNGQFGQTGPRVGSFDGGFGSSLLARNIGVKRAKEVWFLCRLYDAGEALEMGLVNAV